MSVKGKIETVIAAAFANPQTALLVTGVIVAVLIILAVIGIFFWAFHQTDSKQEKIADNSRVTVIEKQSDVNTQAPKVDAANSDVRTAEKNSREAEKELPAAKERVRHAEENVNKARDYHDNPDFQQANSERCETYSDPGCNGAFESQRRP